MDAFPITRGKNIEGQWSMIKDNAWNKPSDILIFFASAYSKRWMFNFEFSLDKDCHSGFRLMPRFAMNFAQMLGFQTPEA